MDDDLYFDDGMIDEVNFDDTEKFDESVLDDPTHHKSLDRPRSRQIPLQDMRARNPRVSM